MEMLFFPSFSLTLEDKLHLTLKFRGLREIMVNSDNE